MKRYIESLEEGGLKMLYKDIYSFTPTGKIENDIKVFLLKYKKNLHTNIQFGWQMKRENCD